MNGYQELTIGKAMAYATPAAGGVAAAAAVRETQAISFLGMNADEWALAGFVLAATYSALMILLTLPRIIAELRRQWRRLMGLFRRGPDESDADRSDQAGA